MKRIIAKKIANELVEVAIYGRKLDTPSAENGILNMFNGIKYLIEQLNEQCGTTLKAPQLHSNNPGTLF